MKVPQAIDSTYPLSIGGHANSTYVFNGRVDEVALYKRILSVDERAWLYNSTAGRAYSELTTSSTYTYDASHPHAVSALNGNSYQYDANGNQQVRSITSGPLAGTYNLYYDMERYTKGVQLKFEDLMLKTVIQEKLVYFGSVILAQGIPTLTFLMELMIQVGRQLHKLKQPSSLFDGSTTCMELIV